MITAAYTLKAFQWIEQRTHDNGARLDVHGS